MAEKADKSFQLLNEQAYQIRKYTSRDQEKVVELLRLNSPKFFDLSEEEDFISYLQQDSQNYFVAEDFGTIIGSGGINYGFDGGKTARISWDIIHPDQQGKGVGKRLSQYRINQIKQNPAVEMISVRTSQLVYPFYQKLGFVVERTEKDFWAKGFHLYQMALDLRT